MQAFMALYHTPSLCSGVKETSIWGPTNDILDDPFLCFPPVSQREERRASTPVSQGEARRAQSPKDSTPELTATTSPPPYSPIYPRLPEKETPSPAGPTEPHIPLSLLACYP